MSKDIGIERIIFSLCPKICTPLHTICTNLIFLIIKLFIRLVQMFRFFEKLKG